MNNPKRLILRILAISSILLILLIGFFIFLIKKNGITEFDQKAVDYKPILVKTERTTPEFELGKEIFMEDCRMCHVSKNMKHNHLSGIVEKVGIDYLKTYLTKQDSLLKAKDEYAIELKEFWNNNGAIHKFNNPQEKEICRSLICWINEGSHTIPDDLFVELQDNTIENYFKVFKLIFKETGHIEHYNMMMN